MSIDLLQPSATPTAWLVLLVLAPVAEEIVFRAGLQQALVERLRGRIAGADGIAVLATALAFAAAHALARPGIAAWGVGVPALVIGVAYVRWQRVDACIGLHALCNAIWLPAARFFS